MLRIPSSFRLTLAGGITLTCQQAAARLGRGRRWEIRSAGSGSTGERWYAWAWLGTASARHHLLIRRHLATGELAFHYCFLPEGQPTSPARPVRAAGLRCPAERVRLDSWLDFQRATLLHKCAGLTGEQLAGRPVASSQLSLLGLVRHIDPTEARLGGLHA